MTERPSMPPLRPASPGQAFLAIGLVFALGVVLGFVLAKAF